VEMVSEGSPAACSGIKVGDLISTLDGIALSNAQQVWLIFCSFL